MRLLFFIAGWVCFIAGWIGLFMPVLPTTPFMLLALWCFSRSSPRFERWLYNHRLFGPSLQQWRRYRVIPLPAKVMAVFFMSCSLLYLVLYSAMAALWLGLIGLVMAYGCWFVLSKPSYPPGHGKRCRS